MSEIVAIVEGETEQTFVRDQLAAHLSLRGTTIWAVLPGRHRQHGGVKKWTAARQDIIRTLREGRYCTTMFDYYAMPENWPGHTQAKTLVWNERAKHIESALLNDITAAMGGSFNPKYFIPYIQLHEFEALTFADVEKLGAVVAPLGDRSVAYFTQKFSEILDIAGHPEAINGHFETCPSRRITQIVRAYKKRLHSPIVTRRIGLDGLREHCTHFASWLERLERIKNESD